MTHEIKQLFHLASQWQQHGRKSVLVTVVALDGSSYRRPGVRMLINDNDDVFGAVSGGCVEKEIQRQAQSVLKTNIPKMMTYDGRLRLGCEGILYILIEPLHLSDELLKTFNSVLKNRSTFKIESYFTSMVTESESLGTEIVLDGKRFSLRSEFKSSDKEKMECFTQTFPPLFQLYIFGAEHDAVQLSLAASNLGWEVTIVADPNESKTLDYFTGATHLITPTFEQLNTSAIDEQTAVILMTHSFNKDVQYLMALKDVSPAYFGLLGSVHRRERILGKFLEYHPETDTEFLEQIYGPAGINIGAESPAEIAISVLAEVLSVVRKKTPMPLREKIGNIHV